MTWRSTFSNIYVSFWGWRLFLALSLILLRRQLVTGRKALGITQTAKGLWRSDHLLNHGLEAALSLLIVRSSWCVRRSPGQKSQEWVAASISNLTCAGPLTSLPWAFFICWRRQLDQMVAGILCNGPSGRSRKLLRERSLRGLMIQPQGQEEDKTPWSLVKNQSHQSELALKTLFPPHSASSPATHVLSRHSVNTCWEEVSWSQGAFSVPGGGGREY